jgi:hypothetical protein
VAEDLALDVHVAEVAAGEELGDVLVGGPVHRDAQLVAVLGLEVLHVLGSVNQS